MSSVNSKNLSFMIIFIALLIFLFLYTSFSSNGDNSTYTNIRSVQVQE